MSLSLSQKAMDVKPSSTLAITAKAKELKKSGVDVVGFGAGEPDFNTPKNICDAAIKAIETGFTKYTPASGTNELKAAISKKFRDFNGLDYAPEQIVVSNGGKHALTNIFNAIINEGDEVIIPAPYWLSYPEMVKLSGGVPVFVFGTKENGYKITAKQLEEAVTDKTKALVLNSPNNPTGMVYSKKELQAIADVAIKHDFYVISDEMYENLIYGNEKHVSIASLNDEIYKRTITCSGLSKSYAMTGWRIGYTGSSVEIAKLMSAMQSHLTSNPNSIAQFASCEALNGPQDDVEKMKKEFDRRRAYMYDRVKAMPYVDVSKPQGAFYVFIDMSKAVELSYKGEKLGSASKLAQCLLNDYAVAVIPCADFGFPNHIRLSYAISIGQIEKGLGRIEEFLKELQ
ncbi:MAG: pyridoxal phosphate-dependent aminotransferase [Lachnospiraceae bacterium]|jgi:aspartate aminotransferase|nr:pyridoxal phosphate-dependent aminotransferase [Lachnospiraceae bacterium]MBP5599456.1 pyridoxal phosphate-dependent aminotransferase [Lachnospiraceae bacterium]